MKTSFFIVLLFFGIGISAAQTDSIPKTEFTKMYLPVWMEATEHCIAIAKAMPEELYVYRTM